MNYYYEKKTCDWVKEQDQFVRQHPKFLASKFNKQSQNKGGIFINKSGDVHLPSTGEILSGVVVSWDDWKKLNYSQHEENCYNQWIEESKAVIKSSEEFKSSSLANILKTTTSHLPWKDGIEIFEDGSVQLATGEKYSHIVSSFSQWQLKQKEGMEQLMQESCEMSL
jgi:hypothetical protein